MLSKVLHIAESTATGTLSMVSLVANAQAAIGCSVTIIYSRRSETPKNINELFHHDVELINVQMLSTTEKVSALFKIRKYIKTEKPSSVIMHSSFGGFIGRMASVGLSGKYYYLPHCISFMRQDISGMKRFVFALLEWVGAIKGATYVACSQSEAVQVRRYIPFRRCEVIENAVDTGAWAGGVDWDRRKTVVITVGQIRNQKDPERFADIVSSVLSKRQDIEFVWVGDGDQSQKDLLVNNGVTVTGWKRPAEVKKLLEASKYYLSTSLWEGMPVSPIEGMLSGCVAILSACDGNVDIVESGQTGFIYSDQAEAIDILEHLLEYDEEASAIASAGCEYCMQRFSQERYIQDFSNLIGIEA